MRTKRYTTIVLTAVLVAATLLTSACVVAGYSRHGAASWRVGFAPPPLQADVVIERPGPDHVWIAGHYEWTDERHDYVWTPGRWERPPHSGAVWVPPHYDERDGSYVSGYWRG
ncbi:MAG TPA: hypothetical protein VGE98_08625 [Thermoanaerobaculia bacterium]